MFDPYIHSYIAICICDTQMPPKSTCNSQTHSIVAVSKVIQSSRSYIFVFLKSSSHKVDTYDPDMRFPTMWYVRPAKAQTSSAYVQTDQSLCSSLEYSMTVKLLTEHHMAVQAHLSLHLSKCHIVGNHMSRLTYQPSSYSSSEAIIG